MNTLNHTQNKWIAIILSIFIIFIGIIVGFLMHKYMSNRVVKGISQLGNISTKTAKDKDLKTIIYENQKAVVQIIASNGVEECIGSGFLYNKKGDVITNAHVVAGASSVTVKLANTSAYSGQVIGFSKDFDVALVRVPELSGVDPVKINESEQLQVGDEIVALGSPLGLQNTATTGIISGIGRNFDIDEYHYKNVYQISAPITHGNSGGPLLSKKDGRVVGINAAGTETGNIGFSIPINNVLDMIKGWSENPSIEKEQVVSQDSSKLTGNDLKDAAEYLVGYFYESISANDYVMAYALLGSSWQKDTSYETFRKGYINTLDVRIVSMDSNLIDGESASVAIIIEAYEHKNNREDQISTYSATYKVAYENGELKIISGEASKLK